jgi:hypothetical protein
MLNITKIIHIIYIVFNSGFILIPNKWNLILDNGVGNFTSEKLLLKLIIYQTTIYRTFSNVNVRKSLYKKYAITDSLIYYRSKNQCI